MQKFFIGILILVFALVGLEAVQVARFLLSSPDVAYEEKIILIEPSAFIRVAEKLEAEHVITDAKKFEWMARFLRQASKVRVGEYEFSTKMRPLAVLGILTSGKSILHTVTIQEGLNSSEIIDLLAEKKLIDVKKFSALLKDKEFIKSFGLEAPSLEGYLYPDTYSFTRFTGERTIIKTMVDQFKQVWEHEVARGAKALNWPQKNVVILASMIEKETGASEERPIISSVFHNRLKINMPLQSDPTVTYGKVGDKKNITRVDLKTDHPYNTYTRKGLPFGPISNPGRGALIAAVEPSATKYLYFVSRNNGTHIFSDNYSDHNRAVQSFQMNAKAREGKSWRDRLKKAPASN